MMDPVQPPGIDAMNYLGEMHKSCAGTGLDAEAVENHWRWYLDGVLAVADSLVEDGVMNTPSILPRIRKLLKKKKKNKKSAPDTPGKKRKTGQTPHSDSLEDEDEDDLDLDMEDEEMEEEEQAAIKKPVSTPVKEKPSKAKKRCVLELAKPYAVCPSGKHAHWNLNLASYMRSLMEDPCQPTSAALQSMLLDIFSAVAVGRLADFAHTLRENADVMRTARIDYVHKHKDPTFAELGCAIESMMKSEANTVVSDAFALLLFSYTGRLLASYIDLLRNRNSDLHDQYSTAYAHDKDVQRFGKQDTTDSYRAFIISSTVSATYGANAPATRPVVEKQLRIAEVIHWFATEFGYGILALLLGGSWRTMAFNAWDFRVPGALRHLATESPSLIKVCKLANDNVWACFNNDTGIRVPLKLKYEIFTEKQVANSSLIEILATEFDDATVLEDFLD